MKWTALALTLAAVAYAATGIYTVGTDQRAVVRRFGRVIAEHSEPGLHFGLPSGLDRVDLVKPSETKTVTIGMTGPADRMLGTPGSDSVAQFLTGDQNLVIVQATVQYAMQDPKQFLFASADPSRVIARAAEASITETLADQSIDAVLTTGKAALALRIKEKLQARLDACGLGVKLRSLNLTEAAPPPQVADAFTRAASARSDRERLIIEARTYTNDRLAQTRSEAKQAIDRATADHDRAIDLARADADRFSKLLYQYRKEPGVAATRLYLETIAEIVPRFRSKIFSDSGKGVDVLLMREER